VVGTEVGEVLRDLTFEAFVLAQEVLLGYVVSKELAVNCTGNIRNQLGENWSSFVDRFQVFSAKTHEVSQEVEAIEQVFVELGIIKLLHLGLWNSLLQEALDVCYGFVNGSHFLSENRVFLKKWCSFVCCCDKKKKKKKKLWLYTLQKEKEKKQKGEREKRKEKRAIGSR